jgi:hypothetical protein
MRGIIDLTPSNAAVCFPAGFRSVPRRAGCGSGLLDSGEFVAVLRSQNRQIRGRKERIDAREAHSLEREVVSGEMHPADAIVIGLRSVPTLPTAASRALRAAPQVETGHNSAWRSFCRSRSIWSSTGNRLTHYCLSVSWGSPVGPPTARDPLRNLIYRIIYRLGAESLPGACKL